MTTLHVNHKIKLLRSDPLYLGCECLSISLIKTHFFIAWVIGLAEFGLLITEVYSNERFWLQVLANVVKTSTTATTYFKNIHILAIPLCVNLTSSQMVQLQLKSFNFIFCLQVANKFPILGFSCIAIIHTPPFVIGIKPTYELIKKEPKEFLRPCHPKP